MAADRIIRCTNRDGISMKFTEDDFVPFLLVSADGIYDAINNVHVSQNTMIDGAQFQGSTVKYRNIVLTLKDTGGADEFIADRNLLDQLFKDGEYGTLEFTEGGQTRVIEYVVEYSKCDGNHTKRLHTISLICPDPFFYDPEDTSIYLASWESNFEFEFEDEGEGFEFGYQSPVKIQNIVNENAENNIGLTIRIRCNGPVTNPSIVRVESDTHIKVGSAAKSLETEAGDIITITTATGNKHVYLTREGVTTEINEYLTEDSEFIQLMRGNNNIGYDADAGDEYMMTELSYRFKHARA